MSEVGRISGKVLGINTIEHTHCYCQYCVSAIVDVAARVMVRARVRAMVRGQGQGQGEGQGRGEG